MLSESIRNLRATLRSTYVEGRLTRQTLELALERLAALADQAEALEGSAIAPAALLNDANTPSNVVRLARKLDRAGVTVGLPEGGAA
ncbi:MAG: hypothetical protein RBS99_14805 [Rhodospirillales bacterium]|jgi:hypothetical protein|nr:hypothetical protein [Rhodospirillales bacterium]